VAEQRARELAWAAFMAYYIEDSEYRVDLLADDKDTELRAEEQGDIYETLAVPADAGALATKIEELTRTLKECTTRSGIPTACGNSFGGIRVVIANPKWVKAVKGNKDDSVVFRVTILCLSALRGAY